MADTKLSDSDSGEASQPKKRQRRKNRFARHPKTTIFCLLVTFVLVMEICSYLAIVAFGHQKLRGQTQLNRQISGYTVYKNTPNYDMSSSTIKVDPADPDVVLDEYGFITDEPLTIEKPPNSVRIFILGGSAAFGAGQDQRYHGTHSYPGGVYSYPRSIAGQLKVFLKKQKPNMHFEVVNAAAYRRMFHQSMLLYLEKISRFDPDFVVNIEGWNDIGSFRSGTPYADAEWMLDALVQLNNKPTNWLHRSNTYYVLATAYEKFRIGASKNTPAATIEGREFSLADYRAREEKFVNHSARYLQILRQYVAALKADETKLVFVLQPNLHRDGANKSLSTIEQKLLNVAPFGDPDSDAFVDHMLIARHFFDNHLSGELSKIVTGEGQIYIDGNQAIRPLDEQTELFSDYCHLLPDGSKFLGRTIGRAILDAMPAND